jgi:hypothetical protein
MGKGQASSWLVDWLIMSMGWDVSEPRPPTGLLFIPRVICERGEPWWWWWWWRWWRWCRLGKLLTCPPGLSGNPTSRDIWERVGGTDEGENFAYQYLRYVNGFLTSRKILRHGAPGFTSHPKEGVLLIIIYASSYKNTNRVAREFSH